MNRRALLKDDGMSKREALFSPHPLSSPPAGSTQVPAFFTGNATPLLIYTYWKRVWGCITVSSASSASAGIHTGA